MRYSWVSASIVLADLLVKLLLSKLGLASTNVVAAPAVAIEFLNEGGTAFARYFETSYAPDWLLLAGLLGIFLALFRIGGYFLNAYPRTNLGLQCASGGILIWALDGFVYGSKVPLVAVTLGDQLPIPLGLSDVAITVGLALLASDLVYRRAAPKAPELSLRRAVEPAIDLSRLKRGIDNVHIDVRLSPRFTRVARSAIEALVSHHLSSLTKRPESHESRKQLLDHFAKIYAEMMRAAMHLAKTAREPERVDLLQLAVIHFLQQETNAAIVSGIQKLSDDLQRRQMLGYRATAEQSERMIWWFRNRNAVFHKVSRTLFAVLSERETNSVSELRDSLFGSPHSVVGDSFSIPLLQAPSPDDDYILMQYYVLLDRRPNDPYSFPQVDRLLNRVLGTAPLPNADESPAPHLKVVADSGMYQRPFQHPSPLMAPGNAAILLDSWRGRMALGAARRRKRNEKARKLKAHLRYQKQLHARLRAALEHESLVQRILIAYETARLHEEYADTLTPQALAKLVGRSRNLLALRQHYRSLRRSGEHNLAFRPITRAARKVHRKYMRDVSDVLYRFVSDFASYRRDLYTWNLLQQAISEMRLHTDDQDVETSRANQRLYEFLLPTEYPETAARITGHAILKADLRGSTDIAEELERKGLNAATHFSLNFFRPINKVIRYFGGEKIFVEGDAVIIQFSDRADPRSERLSVARACGLAQSILRIVDYHNEKCRRYHLPMLELGIGVSYNEGAPTYLFDGDRRVVISTAINRADRLSSNARRVAEVGLPEKETNHHVWFYETAPDSGTGTINTDLIHNVNGIALETQAYEKLQTEVTLKYWEQTPAGEGLYLSRYPDPAGKMQTLVIREAPVYHYDEESGSTRRSERHYYEVITDRALVSQMGDLAATGR